MREEEPTKTKSWAVLLWHCSVWQTTTRRTVSKRDSDRDGGDEKHKIRATGRKQKDTRWKNILQKTEKLSKWIFTFLTRKGLGAFPLVLVCQRLKPPSASTIPNYTNIQRAEIRVCWCKDSVILHLTSDTQKHIALCLHTTEKHSPFRWFGSCPNYIPGKNVNGLIRSSSAYITTVKSCACPVQPNAFTVCLTPGQSRQRGWCWHRSGTIWEYY